MQDKKNRDFFIISLMLFVSLIYILSKDISIQNLEGGSFKSFFSNAFVNQFGAIGTANATSTTRAVATSTVSNIQGVKGLPPESPTNYTDNRDGTISDNYTGLVWIKCTQGMSGSDCKSGSPSLRVWSKARTECDDLTFAGKTDWRLPTLKELQSIVNSKEYDPAINKTFFVNTTDNPYWTETSPAEYLASKFTVLFSDGSVYYKDSNNYAATRCVRGGN